MIAFSKVLSRGHFITYTKRPNFDFIQVEQRHKKHFLKVPADHSSIPNKGYQADGIYTLEKAWNIPLCIKTADCLPVAIIGPLGVGMVHAGWRGIARGILVAPEIKELAPEHFFIGPHITAQAYEVKEEFRREFPDSPHFMKVKDKLFFELAAEARRQILTAFPRAQVEDCNICTFSHTGLHSYRRDGGGGGECNWNVFHHHAVPLPDLF